MLRYERTPGVARVRDGGDRAGRAAWTAFALLALLLAGYLAFLVLRASDRFSPWLDGWLVVGFEFAASALCAASALAGRRRRRVAFAMAAACLAWTVGDFIITLQSLGGAQPPSPSLADVFYLAFFPLAALALVLFVRGEIGSGNSPNWLDGAIGMAALCAGLAFHGLEHIFGNISLSDATNLAYPVADLLLLGIVAGSTVVVKGSGRATLVLVAVGLAVNAAGDTFNFVGANGHAFGAVMNAIAWPTSLLVIAASMWVGDARSGRFALPRLSGFALPGIVACSSFAILVAGSWHRFGTFAIALAAVTVALAGLRLAFRPALRIAREQLRSSEERYRHLFERNPQPLVAYDRATLEIVAVSDAMVNAYGYSREEFHAMTIEDLQPPGGAARLRAHLASLRPGDEPTEAHPDRHRRRDGTFIDVEVAATNVELDGRACRIALFQDVTERKRAAAELAVARDRAVEASNMKSAFLANVSHEVRTPMNGVLGMTDLLLGMGLTGEQREYAEQVARSGRQMLSIINDILDLSKIETGHLSLDIADFDLHEAFNESCSAAGAQARAKGLRLDMEIGAGVPRRVRGDGRRLHQVLLNIVSNAVKFTAQGAVGVRIDARLAPTGTTMVRVEVTDSGIGVDPANLHRMFEPFTQADVSTTRLYGGTGLGLSISRELVELMGGTIGADSELGAGSTFWFEVPLAPAALAPLASPGVAPVGGDGAERWVRPPLVLVAEDSQINQIVAARALERCGCRVDVVGSGVDALDALERERYDAVMMDCQMPKLDGYEATAELRRREGESRHTIVIAMTAHAMDGDRDRCIAAGMDDYISKPMRHGDLLEVLQRALPAPLREPQVPALAH